MSSNEKSLYTTIKAPTQKADLELNYTFIAFWQYFQSIYLWIGLMGGKTVLNKYSLCWILLTMSKSRLGSILLLICDEECEKSLCPLNFYEPINFYENVGTNAWYNKIHNFIFKRIHIKCSCSITSSQYFTYKIAIRDMCASVQRDSSLLYKPIACYINMYTSIIKRLFYMEKTFLKVQTPI